MPRAKSPSSKQFTSDSLGKAYCDGYLVFSLRPILNAPNPIGETIKPVRPSGRHFNGGFPYRSFLGSSVPPGAPQKSQITRKKCFNFGRFARSPRFAGGRA